MNARLLMAVGLCAAVATLAGCSGAQSDSAPAASSSSVSSDGPAWLMALDATAGTFAVDGDSVALTLTGVHPTMIAFTDRPDRQARHLVTASFLSEQWDATFGDDPPNATVVVLDGNQKQDMVVLELLRPQVKPDGSVVFPATRVQAGGSAAGRDADESLPATFADAAVFIDDVFLQDRPFVTGISPNSGLVAGGTTVVLTGSNFTGMSSLSFGGTPAASFSVDSNTQVTAVTPAHDQGTVDIGLTNPAGGGTVLSGFTFIWPPPVISSVQDPWSLAPKTVVITGSGFTRTSSVTFGGDGAKFTVDSDTQISVITPVVEDPGTVTLSVKTPGGTASFDSFEFRTGGGGAPS